MVYRSVQWVVAFGLKHRDLSDVHAIDVDEIAVWSHHRYLTVVYQLDEGRRRLLWIGRTRKKEALDGFFAFWGKARTRALEFVCSDMWKAYISVIAKRAGSALHVLDRFHIVMNMNKVVDKVRASEARAMAKKGYDPLAKTRWCFLKRKAVSDAPAPSARRGVGMTRCRGRCVSRRGARAVPGFRARGARRAVPGSRRRRARAGS